MIASPLLEHLGDLLDGRLGDLAGGDHDPDGARGVELLGQLLQRGGAGRALALELLDRVGVDVVDDAIVAVAHQPPHEVRSHPAEADHSELCHPSSPPSFDASILRRSSRLPNMAQANPSGRAQGPPADALVIFGITGDLAKKMTLKALYDLVENDTLKVPVYRRRPAATGRTRTSISTPARRSRHGRRPEDERARRGRLQEVHREAHLRPGRLRRRRHLQAPQAGALLRQAPGLLPGDPAVAVRRP